jgi:hypothetical protein
VRDRVATVLLALLLAIGFYFPTSRAETISVKLYLACAASLLAVLSALLLRRGGVLGALPLVNFAAINVLLLVATLFSPFHTFAYGGYIPILLFSILFCVRVKDIRLTDTARRLFDIANAINLGLALLLMLKVPAIVDLFLRNYAYGYEELVPYMLEEGKPVLTFGSHSIAGFFFYLLFYVTLQTFVARRTRLHLLYAIGYLGLLLSLASFTSMVFGAVATAQLALSFEWRKSVVAGLATAALLVIGIGFAAPRLDAFAEFHGDLVEILSRKENGLIGRYSSTGGLSANLEYITGHPFAPIGLGMSWQLWYSDSGPVEYVLKGSFPLLIAVYAGAFLFLRKNLVSKQRAFFLFAVFLSFELGYSNLQYIRTQCFLPFLLVYLNWLDRPAPRHA